MYASSAPANVLDQALLHITADDLLNRRIVAGELTFGDGTSTPITGSESVAHDYTADGDYRRGLTVTTADGRTGTATATLRVETHDITVIALTAPATARPDQTKPITVEVTNNHYDETVHVELYKTSADGATRVGALTLSVPAGRTVQFPFAYTFSPADAATVTFRAVARLTPNEWTEPNRNDNEMTATTTVRR